MILVILLVIATKISLQNSSIVWHIDYLTNSITLKNIIIVSQKIFDGKFVRD